jgi:hypothetical protein
VVRSTGVEVLAVDLVVAGTIAKEGVGMRLVEVEQGGASRRGKGKV